MARSSEKSPSGGSKRRVVKPPTIDLTASEVEDRSAAETASAKDASVAAEEAAAATETEAGKAETEAATEAPRVEREPAAGSRSGGSFIGGAAAGALAGAVVALAAYWLLAGDRPGPDISGLETRLQAVESRSIPTPPDNSVMESRLAALESAQGDAALKDEIARLSARVEELAGASGGATDGTALAALSERVDGLAAKLDSQQPATDDGALDALRQSIADSIAALQARVEALEKAMAERQSSGGIGGGVSGAKVHAAIAIRDGVWRGNPDARLVADAEKLGLDVSGVAPAIEAGIVSTAELRAMLADKAGAMIRAAEPPASGILGRIGESARSIVSIRPVGPLAGDTPDAAVSRIEAALEAGDTAGAAEAFAGLPEASRAAAGGFGEALMRRAEALRAADALVASAIDG